MKKLLIALTLVTGVNFNAFADNDDVTPIPPAPPAQFATDVASCEAVGAHLLVGTVEATPAYVGSKTIQPLVVDGKAQNQGILLSHTHILVQPLNDSNPADAYEIAADNVFAAGYDQAQPNKAVPAPLSSLQVGQVIEACGLTYSQTPFKGGSVFQANNGIHWVHSNDQPISPGHTTNGWLKEVDSSGNVGTNLEGASEYFCLWHSPTTDCNLPADAPLVPYTPHGISIAQSALLPW
ncbi:hypothetical protein [Aquella oligotrophica]|uniref:Uncharacterized protein n=1 Tax=Aquella oligotrophica TaxID=2067065 RepID=A0A2I7N7U3_9NEIS|nr:hypothetical protein [Aquella oligotrophica]AUR52529.1 hypothetical protein CUN60_09540 [Aquella oligotrophica]